MPLFPIDVSDRKEIGKTKEYVSAIGLGTWAIRSYRQAEEVFVYALEHGIDNIDTAEIYDNGEAEKFVGRVVKRVGRGKVFITTKMKPDHLISKERVLKAAKASIERLGVKEVDLLLIHWPNIYLPIETQIRNFEAVFIEGLARYIGVSNFNVRELEIAINSTRSAEIVVNQVHYSILHREVERDLLPLAIKEGITIQAYTPIEKGAVIHHPIIKDLAARVKRTPIQVSLNFLISRPRVIAIPKTETMSHLKEILGSMGWRLSEYDIEYLERYVY